MYKFVIALILTFLCVCLISGGDFSAAAQPTKQETHGPNSPAAYTLKGNIKITINESEEIRKIFQEAFESSKNGKDIEISELKKRLSEIHQTQLRVLPQEADEWAEHFLSTLPLRKDKVKTQEMEEAIRFENERMNIPILFEYIIKKFDEYILELKKHDKNIDLKQDQIPEIITYDNSFKEYGSLRIASFPNGTSLKVWLQTGVIRNGRIQNPYLKINLIKNGTEETVLFVTPTKYGGGYIALSYGDGELTDQFKKRLTRAYDIIIEEAYLSSSKAPVRNLRTVP